MDSFLIISQSQVQEESHISSSWEFSNLYLWFQSTLSMMRLPSLLQFCYSLHVCRRHLSMWSLMLSCVFNKLKTQNMVLKTLWLSHGYAHRLEVSSVALWEESWLKTSIQDMHSSATLSSDLSLLLMEWCLQKNQSKVLLLKTEREKMPKVYKIKTNPLIVMRPILMSVIQMNQSSGES